MSKHSVGLFKAKLVSIVGIAVGLSARLSALSQEGFVEYFQLMKFMILSESEKISTERVALVIAYPKFTDKLMVMMSLF